MTAEKGRMKCREGESAGIALKLYCICLYADLNQELAVRHQKGVAGSEPGNAAEVVSW